MCRVRTPVPAWEGPRAGLDILEKRKICRPCRHSNHRPFSRYIDYATPATAYGILTVYCLKDLWYIYAPPSVTLSLHFATQRGYVFRIVRTFKYVLLPQRALTDWSSACIRTAFSVRLGLQFNVQK